MKLHNVHCISSLIISLFYFFNLSNLNAQPEPDQFRINPDNPHYFLYKRKPIFLCASGSGNDLRWSKSSLVNYKENHSRMAIWTYDSNGSGSPDRPYIGDDMRKGFNPEYWNRLRSDVEWAYQNDVIIGVRVFATSILETSSPGRWGGHSWNSRWGGPLKVESNGKDAFYTLFDYNNPISGPYNDNWPWEKKNQYRQEELLDKVLTELDLPNVYILLMWEIHDTGGSSQSKAANWWRAMARYIHNKRPGTLVAPGEASGSNALFGGGLIARWVMELPGLDFMVFENRPVFENDLKEVFQNYWSINIPFVHVGTRWPWRAAPDHQFSRDDIKTIKKSLFDMVRYGFQPAAPFGGHSYQDGRSKEFHNYLKTLHEFMDSVTNWCDEPNQEINQQTLPSISGSAGINLPGSTDCSDTFVGGNSEPDVTAPLPPKGTKVEQR